MVRKILSLSLLILGLGGVVWAADCFDHGGWSKIIEANVDDEGLVDYDGVRINKGGNLIEYLTFVEIEKLTTCTQIEKAAFWINAYNANVFRLISGESGLEILTSDHSIYKKRFYAGNQKLSLHLIKERVLRGDTDRGGPIKSLSIAKFDPRFHFALVDGSRGAASLPKKALEPTGFDELLDGVTKAFLGDSKNIRIENNELVLSELFLRYRKDFDGVGGVVAFISKYLDPKFRSDAKAIASKLKSDFPDNVRYDYDWSVNRQKQ